MSLISTDRPLQDTVWNRPAATEDLRQRCRQCRAQLPAPVSDARAAFCSRGCHACFFRTRCRVCEAAIEQPARGRRLICNKAKCKNAWRASFGLGRYPTLNGAESIQEVPVNRGPKVAITDDRARPWLVVAAGKSISANCYHCAIVGADAAIATARIAHSSDTSRFNPIAAAVSSWAPTTRSVPDPQDLSIPEFLRRAAPPLSSIGLGHD